MNIFQAIAKLNPKIASVNGDTMVATDVDGKEIAYDIDAAKELVAQTDYMEKRAMAYPSIGDQLDALYHGGYEGWKAMVDEVKNQYPKPLA